MTKHESFEDAAFTTAESMARLVIKKQRDYGPDNILKCPVGAELGIAVRLYDKIARLSNLVQGGHDPANETLVDTAYDIMGYGLVLAMVLDKNFTLPMMDDGGIKLSSDNIMYEQFREDRG